MELQVAEEGAKWVIAGTPLATTALKPIKTKPSQLCAEEEEEEEEEDIFLQLTPRREESIIPQILLCPPAPKKPRPSLQCNLEGIEFFNVPELESVFIRRVETAK